MKRALASVLGGLATGAILGACGSHAVRVTAPDASSLVAGLVVRADIEPVTGNDRLRRQLYEDVHKYFRFIAIPFGRAVCQYFGAGLDAVPAVKLHGDPHLEQYAVTDAGRGLTDFDDSSYGPAPVDLVRFGVSLRLGLRARGWQDQEGETVDRFLGAYTRALHDVALASPEPAFVARLEATFSDDRSGFLAWADSVVHDIDPAVRQEAEVAFRDYAARAHETLRELDADFFAVKRCGTNKLGVGSSGDEKYVFRIEGATAAPDDDIMLEAKEVRNLENVPCVRAGAKANPFRILVGPVRTPYEPYLGYFGLHEKSFWVHAWIANYKELEIADPELTIDDFGAVAFEAGVQLARAHLQRWDGAPDRQLGHRVEHAIGRLDQPIRDAIATLAEATLLAWDRYRLAVAPGSTETAQAN